MKLKIGFGVIVLLLASALSTYAQNINPCNGGDDDGTCPLDTWVVVLVAAVSVFAVYRLYRRKKSSIQTIR
jgi:hypothetical protein